MKNKAVKILLGISVSLIICGGVFYKFHPHNYALVDAKEPSCTEDGYNKYKCWCGAESTETLEAIGHSYQEKIIDATCTEDGKEVYTCSNCGDTYENSIKATGHDFKEEVTTEPTCIKEGITTFKCSNCGDAFTESIAPLGHSFIDGICERCGELSEEAKKKQEESKKKQGNSGNSGQTGTGETNGNNRNAAQEAAQSCGMNYIDFGDFEDYTGGSDLTGWH